MPKLFYDLHIHSCLSPCGDGDMTPYNLVNMAKVMGLHLIALTDHNSSRNCPAAAKAAEEAGIIFVPGMELTTAEEVHVVCLFKSVDAALEFSDYVFSTLPKVKNRTDIFGEQLVMDHLDGVTDIEENLLSIASGVTVSKCAETVASFGGICYPAHIDRPSFSLISNLGGINPGDGFLNAELTPNANLEKLRGEHPALNSMRILRSSDAHYLENISPAENTLELGEESVQGLFELLGSRITGV